MCQTSLISDKIKNLSGRSFIQRIEIAAPNGFNLFKLTRLNSDLDKFYDLIYSQWSTISEEDYRIFGNQLEILLATIHDLLMAYENFNLDRSYSIQIEKLKSNYSALYELNSDIINFKINMPKDSEVYELLNSASMVAEKIVR